MTVAGDDIVIIDEEGNELGNITDRLNNITDADSDISLRGCSTAELAENLDEALGGEPTVSGNPIPVIGIPWTKWIGPWYSF